jgi:hypothetical protein
MLRGCAKPFDFAALRNGLFAFSPARMVDATGRAAYERKIELFKK